jgi:hypothetical protein
MRKIVKNIPVFFLWTAWIVMTAHLMIPHDHHLSDSDAQKEGSCPYSQSHEAGKHNSGFPIHCHAFNNTTSEKAITFLLAVDLQSVDFVFGDVYDSQGLTLTSSKIEFSDFRKPLLDSEILELSSLRAPPSL